MGKRMKLQLASHFDAAHYLPGYNGPCASLHGHRWLVLVEIEGEVDQRTGMVIDFSDLKKVLELVLPDHQLLNDILEQPTAENIAQYLWRQIEARLPSSTTLTRLELKETPEQGVVLERATR